MGRHKKEVEEVFEETHVTVNIDFDKDPGVNNLVSEQLPSLDD